MTLTVQIPPEIERQLRAQTADINADAREAMFVEFYRQEKLTRHQLSQALGLSRLETDAILKKHNVTEDLPSLEELEEDFRQGIRLVKQ